MPATLVLTRTERDVLVSIQLLQQALGPRARISLHDIAEAACYHTNTIWTAVNTLEIKGALQRDTKPRHGTFYTILIDISDLIR